MANGMELFAFDADIPLPSAADIQRVSETLAVPQTPLASKIARRKKGREAARKAVDNEVLPSSRRGGSHVLHCLDRSLVRMAFTAQPPFFPPSLHSSRPAVFPTRHSSTAILIPYLFWLYIRASLPPACL